VLDKHAGDVVVRSPVMERLYALAHRAGRGRLPILVLGETGSGKEVLARFIHRASPRRHGPFRAVNCASLPQSLMEGALFGHERGAFTGAVSAQPGLFEQAHQGTLFLDEVGELSAAAQAALLRVLETKTAARIGSGTERMLDVRVIAATHRELREMCAQGQLRDDLFYRINAVTLTLPPLRERRDEIPALVEYFLRTGDLPADSPRRLSPESLARLLDYAWPGNVRELRNAVEHAAVVAVGDTIEVEDLPVTLRVPAAAQAVPASCRTTTFRERVRRFEIQLITDAIEQTHGNVSAAARLLQLPVRTLHSKLRVLGLQPAR
jgi:DNA-binding NtrC family response regulator